MNYKVFLLDNEDYENKKELVHIISIDWDDDIDRIYLNFSFSTDNDIEVGSWIELYNDTDDKTVFRGIITNKSQSSEKIISYSGYDLGFFVEKNKIIKQFKEPTEFSECIKTICKDFEIPVGDLPATTTKITKIYKDNIGNILKDLLKTAKSKGLSASYFYSCKSGKLDLFQYTENANLKAYIGNIFSLYSVNTIHSFNIKSSIEEMKNKISVIIDAKQAKEYTTKPNENIKKYGILQETVEPPKDDKNYSKIAEDKLKELNKIKNEISLNVLGNYEMQAGIIIPIEKEQINLHSKYLIKSSKHSISGTKETVEINVEEFTSNI